MTTLAMPQSVRRVASRPWHMHWWREVGIVAFFYLAYEGSRYLDPTRPVASLRHAASIFNLEKDLHLDGEGAANAFFAAHNWLAEVSGYYYAILHALVAASVLAWLYVKRPEIYRRWRTTLVVASFIGLAVYLFYPTAPPRLSVPGMTDVLVNYNIFGVGHAAKSGGFINIYAAMPSLHVGWAVWAAAAITASFPGSRLRWAAWLYPVATTLVVIGTANHFVLDCVAGALLILAVGLVVRPGVAERPAAESPVRTAIAAVRGSWRPLPSGAALAAAAMKLAPSSPPDAYPAVERIPDELPSHAT